MKFNDNRNNDNHNNNNNNNNDVNAHQRLFKSEKLLGEYTIESGE